MFEDMGEFLESFPQEIRRNQYVVVEYKGTHAEKCLGAFESEIEAFKVYKRVSGNVKEIVRADVRYVNLEGINFIYDYIEI